MIEDYGLFIGLTSISSYSNKDFNPVDFEDKVLTATFNGYRKSLCKSLHPKGTLNPHLYKPINFYAFGSFNIISFSLIDDFHFGNFSFRPYNKQIDKLDRVNSNFRHQVINNFNLKNTSNFNYEEISEERFLGVCKLKINSALLIGNGIDIIRSLKGFIEKRFNDKDKIKLIIGESFSWHELTLVFFSESIQEIIYSIDDIRNLTVKKFEKTFQNDFLQGDISGLHLFTDSETIYGKNKLFFDTDSTYYDKYVDDYAKGENDNKVIVTTKIQEKTGHFKPLLNETLNKEIYNSIFNKKKYITNGRSDYSLKFKKNSIINYLKFWRILQNSEDDRLNIFNNVRKIHSNVTAPIRNNSIECSDVSNDKLKTNFYNSLFEKMKFDHTEITEIENGLQNLKVSKEVTNKVLTLFTNFNDIICDVNLFIYFIDLKSILDELQAIVRSLTSNDNVVLARELKYRKVSKISSALLNYVNVFDTAYRNRYMDSKNLGYNLDLKGDFNGGVHQIIQAYDSIFKIVASTLNFNSEESTFLPIASYGNIVTGIKSSRINLHLSYYQLFQPEFFLFAVIKERINFILDASSLKGLDDLNSMKKILIDLTPEISTSIHLLPDVDKKAMYYDYFPPAQIEKKVMYTYYYISFIHIFGEDKLENFSFWYWNTFIQNSNSYNVDGSLCLDMFKEHFLPFYIAIMQANSSFDFSKENFQKFVKSKDILYYLYDEDINVLKEVKEIFIFLMKSENFRILMKELQRTKILYVEKNATFNDYFQKIRSIINTSLEEFKDSILIAKNEDCSNTYLRDNKTGQGFQDREYYDAVFDPHGGLFTLNTHTRLEHYKKRIKILDELRDISFKFKGSYFD